MNKFKRRDFLKSGSLIAGAGVGMNALAVPGGHNDEILVSIFLRGGIDGLNVVVPMANDHSYYSLMRPTLAIPNSGSGAALQIGSSDFGFNPVAAPLLDLYNDGYLAIVNATGVPNNIASRSHFDAEKYMELGIPGQVSGSSGWLHRHFLAVTEQLDLYPDDVLVPILAFRSTPPASLLGNNIALTVYSPSSFELDNAHWRWDVDDTGSDTGYMQLELLPMLYDALGDQIDQAGAQALIAEQIMRNSYDSSYTGNGVIPYPNGEYFSDRLRDAAQLIKLDIGLRMITLDFNNWDTHDGQNNGNWFNGQVTNLAQALAAFFDDLNRSAGTYADRTTVILQSEFGRRGYENNGNGTDHGNGNVMLILGKQVNGGNIYGTWPGLYPGQEWVNYTNPKNGSWDPELYEGALSVTTDFRQVLSEYLAKRAQHKDWTLSNVFPNYNAYTPLGIFNDVDPHTGSELFSTAFE